MARSTFYVQLKGELGGSPGRWYVRGLRFVRATARRPREPVPGAIVVELTVEIPDELLKPLSPKALIELPVERLDIVVRAEPVPLAE